jgi:hypothetical protein
MQFRPLFQLVPQYLAVGPVKFTLGRAARQPVAKPLIRDSGGFQGVAKFFPIELRIVA